MTNKTLQARIERSAETLAQSAGAHHALGDLAAKVALVAPDRRSQRHALNVNRTTRAVGEGINASLWLFGIVGRGMAKHGAPAERSLPVLDRMLTDALALADDLEFEAHLAKAYLPQPAKRPTRRKQP